MPSTAPPPTSNAAAPGSGAPLPPPHRTSIFVYSGEGAGMRSTLSALEALRASLPRAVAVSPLATADLLAGGWAGSAALLVMPGGADLPYNRDLAGAGNALIRAFVSDGGAYLGLCAGAYYGCARVEFEPGSETGMAVVGPRELAFFPGAAVGAAVPGFAYESEAGAAAVSVVWRELGAPRGADTPPNAAQPPWRSVRDYCNGGPVFTRADGEAWDEDDCFTAGGLRVEVLARYERRRLDGDGSAAPRPPTTSPAPAAAAGGGVVALRASCGAGVAVLCGTHPELAPAGLWLGGGGEDDGGKAAALAADLDAGAAERKAFWEGLLAAAGVGSLMEEK